MLDANSKISAIDVTALKVNGTAVVSYATLTDVVATAAELNVLHQVTAGTTKASCGLVVDANKALDTLTITTLVLASQTLAAADHAALTAGVNQITGANDSLSVMLPAAAPGLTVLLANTVSNKALLVFPNTGDKINGGTATTGSLSVAGGKNVLFFAFDATDWYAVVTA